MEPKKLIPYSVYLPERQHKALKKAAKDRKASELIRDAIEMLLEGGKSHDSGYNQGIRDAVKVVYNCKEAKMIAVKNRNLGVILAESIEELKRK
jgi:metal-responsive CopG/Arc/MetJ family transcriptional regulator